MLLNYLFPCMLAELSSRPKYIIMIPNLKIKSRLNLLETEILIQVFPES